MPPAPNPAAAARGVVQSIAAGQAVIAVSVQGCAACGEKKNCGIGRLAGGGKTTLVQLPAPDGLRVGATVNLAVPAGTIERAALLGYLLPASLLAAGCVAGEAGLGGDLGAALGALGGVILGLLAAGLLPRYFRAAAAPLRITS